MWHLRHIHRCTNHFISMTFKTHSQDSCWKHRMSHWQPPVEMLALAPKRVDNTAA